MPPAGLVPGCPRAQCGWRTRVCSTAAVRPAPAEGRAHRVMGPPCLPTWTARESLPPIRRNSTRLRRDLVATPSPFRGALRRRGKGFCGCGGSPRGSAAGLAPRLLNGWKALSRPPSRLSGRRPPAPAPAHAAPLAAARAPPPAGATGTPATVLDTQDYDGVLGKAVRVGGTTLRDYVGADGSPGYFRQQLQVYERGGEPCRQCSTPIRQRVQAQRSTYWCPKCQK